MVKAKILVVEDDSAISNLIRTTLETQNYQYHTAKTGSGALLDAVSYRPDVIILDLGLPDIDGVEIIQKVRSWTNTPIIVVSARSEDQDKVDALDAGADDYLVKPFHMSELLARMRAVMRRRNGAAANVLSNGDLSLSEAAKTVERAGQTYTLTKREYALLSALLARPGAILSRRALEDRIYAVGEEPDSNAVEYLIHALRKKLGADAVKNVRGLGWMVAGRDTKPE